MKRSLFILLLISFPILSFCQGFTPPKEGNAVVYFVRVSGYGGAISFEFKEGKHLLWASSENKQFIKCELQAGKTYIILCKH